MSDQNISNAHDLFRIWENEGYPDDIGGVFLVDDTEDTVAFLIVNPTKERIDGLNSMIGSDIVFYPSKYSYNELRRIQAEIENKYLEPDGKIYGVGVGWSSDAGFGESEKEFRVIVVVDESEYEVYFDMFLQMYGDKVFVEIGGPYLPMYDSTQAEDKFDNNSEQKPKANFSEHTGYYLRTTDNDFFIAYGDSDMFTNNEFVQIKPVEESWDSDVEKVSFDGLNNGDKIIIKILTVGDLYPRVTQVYQYNILESGKITNIDESVLYTLYNLGFYVVEDNSPESSSESK